MWINMANLPYLAITNIYSISTHLSIIIFFYVFSSYSNYCIIFSPFLKTKSYIESKKYLKKLNLKEIRKEKNLKKV